MGPGRSPAGRFEHPPAPPRRLSPAILGDLSPSRKVGGLSLSAPYTIKQLPQVEDSAVRFGMSEVQEARFAYQALECEDTGFSYHRVKPGRRQAFAHKHDQAEEVYVVLAGAGRVKLDDDIVSVEELDALRVAPGVIRQFEAGPDGMELLAFGARHAGDGEIIPDWWSE